MNMIDPLGLKGGSSGVVGTEADYIRGMKGGGKGGEEAGRGGDGGGDAPGSNPTPVGTSSVPRRPHSRLRSCVASDHLHVARQISDVRFVAANAAAPAAEWRNQDPPPDIGFPLARAFCQGGVKKLALPPAMRKRSRLEGETGRRVGPMALNAA